VSTFRSVNEKNARKWIWFGLAALGATQLYFVREMIAALVLFSVVFAVVAGGALLLYAFDQASQRTLAWAEPQTMRAARVARRGWALVEEISKKPLHHLR
jgi:threonine/homoserine efflux transporter RhtA